MISIFFISRSLADVNPYERGPHTVGHATFWSWSISNWDLDHNLGVWVPEASGNFPVVYFNVGVAGLIPPSFYSILLDHIASHGFVVISPFTYTSIPTFEYKADGIKHYVQTFYMQKSRYPLCVDLPHGTKLVHEAYEKIMGVAFD